MATTTKRGNVVGLAYVQYALVGTDGFAYGAIGETTTGNTTMHAKLLRNARSAGLPTPARTNVDLTGGNRWLGAVQFAAPSIPEFPLVLSDFDAELMAIATASAADQTTNTRWTRGGDNSNKQVLPQVCLIFTALIQSREDGSDGENLYMNYFIPRAQITPGTAEMAFQAPGDVTYTVKPTMAEGSPHGLSFANAAMNFDNNKNWMFYVITPKPLGLTTFIADGIATTYTLGYLPTSSIVTLNSAANEQTVNGTLTAPTSVVPATAVVTLAIAGANGDKVGMLYETDFQAVA